MKSPESCATKCNASDVLGVSLAFNADRVADSRDITNVSKPPGIPRTIHAPQSACKESHTRATLDDWALALSDDPGVRPPQKNCQGSKMFESCAKILYCTHSSTWQGEAQQAGSSAVEVPRLRPGNTHLGRFQIVANIVSNLSFLPCIRSMMSNSVNEIFSMMDTIDIDLWVIKERIKKKETMNACDARKSALSSKHVTLKMGPLRGQRRSARDMEHRRRHAS
jgi:hypothetical protein